MTCYNWEQTPVPQMDRVALLEWKQASCYTKCCHIHSFWFRRKLPEAAAWTVTALFLFLFTLSCLQLSHDLFSLSVCFGVTKKHINTLTHQILLSISFSLPFLHQEEVGLSIHPVSKFGSPLSPYETAASPQRQNCVYWAFHIMAHYSQRAPRIIMSY